MPSLIQGIGWAGMSFSRIAMDLDSHLRTGEKKREALQNLLASGRISRTTYDLMDKQVSRVTTIVLGLKEALTAEETFWKTSLSEEAKILELLLIQLEHMRLLGIIEEEECQLKSKIISSGLESLRSDSKLSQMPKQEPALPVQTTLEPHAFEKNIAELAQEQKTISLPIPNRQAGDAEPARRKRQGSSDEPMLNKRKRLLAKEPPELESTPVSGLRCMNPWKPECKSTNIELSIYYKGRTTPICRKCWEEIANKNVEWSSL
jgi:hypothetical protein